MKKYHVPRGCLLLLIIAILIWSTNRLAWYHETKDCLCSILAEEEKEYPIDDYLFSVAERSMLTSGTFTRISTSCEHGTQIQLTIYPDAGYYSGKKLK